MADAKKSEYQKDEALEAEVKRMGDYPVHPLVSKVTSRMGLLNVIRNARNKNQVEVLKADEPS